MGQGSQDAHTPRWLGSDVSKNAPGGTVQVGSHLHSPFHSFPSDLWLQKPPKAGEFFFSNAENFVKYFV